MKPLLVINAAGLSNNLLKSGPCENMIGLARHYGCARISPVLPAVTQTAQATYITGQDPGVHGVVGNGFYHKEFQEHRFWNASAGLLDAAPFWARGGPKTCALFWWTCLGSKLHTYMNVAPFHLSSGKTVSSCYSDPLGLYPELEQELGPFPLHRFWGPGVSIESSKWILDASLLLLKKRQPEILLTYLPHMDYSLQRSGPGSGEAIAHLKELDDLLGPCIDRALNNEFKLILLSEYGITPVRGSVSLNRILREHGLFQVRRLQEQTFPDLPGSRAFAICDHQVAHVYVREPADIKKVTSILSQTPGVGAVQKGLRHKRSGDLLVLSAKEQWFDYTWWDHISQAPDYAFTVDIHRKIGYDPLELIFDPAHKRIAADTSLIKGSHGLIPENKDDFPIFMGPVVTGPEIFAKDVKDMVLKCLD